MRTRENSSVVSLRVEKELQAEFVALVNETGTTQARVLRDSFVELLDDLRKKANERRSIHGMPFWEEEWSDVVE